MINMRRKKTTKTNKKASPPSLSSFSLLHHISLARPFRSILPQAELLAEFSLVACPLLLAQSCSPISACPKIIALLLLAQFLSPISACRLMLFHCCLSISARPSLIAHWTISLLLHLCWS